MTTVRHTVAAAVAAAALASACFAKDVAPGATILVGQSAEFSGQSIAKENTLGANAYFEHVNRRGGVHGRRIALLSLDDERDKEKTARNTEQLIVERNVLALFGYRSTPSVEAALPIAAQHRVALVAPFTGAASLREPFNPYIFHLRASYQAEAGKLVEHLATLGIQRIAILHQDDSFGKDALAGFRKHMESRKLAAAALASYSRKDLDVAPAVAAISKARPQAVLMACTPKACVSFIKQMRAAGPPPKFYTLSNVNSEEFFKELGDAGRGVVLSQVVPYPWDTGTPIVKEFQSVIKRSKEAPPVTYGTLEGYLAAKLLVEGIRKAGAQLSRERLVAAMESLGDLDLGGMRVAYGPRDHEGSELVEITVVGRNGKLVR